MDTGPSYALCIQEMNEIHALMDMAGVPRTSDGNDLARSGQQLSAAQRVRWHYITRKASDAAIHQAKKGASNTAG